MTIYLMRHALLASRWPDLPALQFGQGVTKLEGGKKRTYRPGLHQCNACREQFTVTVGTVMERSKIPLHYMSFVKVKIAQTTH
jgi:hypothetical protein